MPTQETIIGPFEALYIGHYADTGVKLTRLKATRTKGGRVREAMETEYTPLTDDEEQVGNHLSEVILTFLGADETAIRISKRLPLSSGSMTAAPGTQVYTLFCASGNYTAKSSYYFPRIVPKIDRDANQNKDAATEFEIRFITQNRTASGSLITPGTIAEIQALLGSRSPF